MLKKLPTTIAFLALSSASYAGEAMTSKGVITSPPTSDALNWFIGTSTGLLIDKEEPIYALQFGVQQPIQGSSCSHALYLELGYSEYEEDISSFFFSDNDTVDTELIPLTLNYKYSCALTDRIDWFVGVGAGIAFVKSDSDFDSQDDEVFFAQAFAGVTYKLNQNWKASLGIAYIFMDNPDYSASGPSFPTPSLASGPQSIIFEPRPESGLSSEAEDAASADGDFVISLGLTYVF